MLLNAQSLSKSFGSKVLFQDLSFNICEKDRLGLIGPNGSGKSTLLKIILGLEKTDSGEIAVRRALKIGYVPQSCTFPPVSPKEILMGLLENKEDYIAERWLTKLGFTGNEENASLLSGGWKKRLSIAQELMREPDLLLLDEPTNHLDLEGVIWLEEFLVREAPTYVMVSHDRRFLQKTTNRIMELDKSYPKGQFSVEGSYNKFIEKKEEFLKGQLEQERSLSGVAKRELDWLRRSPKARTTKSQARINHTHEILEELHDIQKRNQKKKAQVNFEGTERETRKLLVAKNITKNFAEKVLFKNLDFTLSPGSRLGLIGSNGSGKTTLLRLIAGEINPDKGTIKRADEINIVYFDQHRLQIPDHISLKEALSPQGDYVQFRGESIHVNGWCKRFLFSPDTLEMLVGNLSGGEKARISVAHLMLKPADILLLDEPTNDLDIDTLQVLEESLIEFPGAVVLITHDREMLDRICTQILALGNEKNNGFFSDYSQWESTLKMQKINLEKPKAKEYKSEIVQLLKPKLTYKEKKEYESIEAILISKEAELHKLINFLSSLEITENALKLQEVCKLIAQIEKEIENLYLRFEELGKKL